MRTGGMHRSKTTFKVMHVGDACHGANHGSAVSLFFNVPLSTLQ